MPKLGLTARQELRAAPALLTLARMLALTGVGLHQAVQDELAANPALEELEGGGLAGPAAPAAGDEERLLRVAMPPSLADVLLSDLRASLPASEHALAALIVGSLSPQGLLEESPAVLARAAGLTRQRVEAALATLRAVGPPGIAARDTRECLLAQLDALDATGAAHSLARAIIAGYLDELGAGRQRAIARALGVEPEAVVEAHAFIRGRLWPYPLQAAEGGRGSPDRRSYHTPDLVFAVEGDSFAVTLTTAPGRWLRLSPAYAALAERVETLPEAEREHVRVYLERAQGFLRALRRRGETLLRVGEALAVRQAAFLRDGPRRLVPLTRLQIAADLGMHESTVCRAVEAKAALLPDRSVCALDDFFAAARPAQELLRELVAAESAPLSDQQLAALLAAQGYPIARRTVAKYRDQLGIPAQQQRARRAL